MKNTTSQILLVGNGINQAYTEISWAELLDSIKVDKSINLKNTGLPEPMLAILATNDNVNNALVEKRKELYGKIVSNNQKEFLIRILNMPVSRILTTNYSYELEMAEISSLSDYKLKAIQSHTNSKKKAESKYNLHTYNKLDHSEIWHIHGEARKPDSMILGHYYYGNLLCKIKNELDTKSFSYKWYENHNLWINEYSWIDSFIMGDVYVFGFGFEVSEIDLWWLLNRKKREIATNKGKVYFYEPQSEKNKNKVKLLRLMDVEVCSLGCSDLNEDEEYIEFYNKVIDDINKRIQNK